MNRLEELEELARRDPVALARSHWQAEQQLSAALAYIAELKRQLFGSKTDRLSAAQETQLAEVLEDLEQQAQRLPPASDGVLEDTPPTPGRTPRRRHPIPPELETVTQVLEPPDKICPHSGQAKRRIGEEVTTQYDLLPAKLICRRTVRPKYVCDCPHCRGVSIAPLPPRLLPQSQLGIGLAVQIVLSR
jgi:hypothetical protein